MTPTPTEREFAVEVVRRLRDAGHEALWAGGCVRDELLGLTPKDYDVATSALPERGAPPLPPHGRRRRSFGVVEVLGPRTEAGPLKVQVATFRSDGTYSDGRRPDAVTVSIGPRRRRAPRLHHQRHVLRPARTIAASSTTSAARTTCAAGCFCAIGDPARRFTEDKLRMLLRGAHGRAVRADHRPGHRRRHPGDGAGNRRGQRRAHRGRVPQDAGGPSSGAGHAAVRGPGVGGAVAAGIAADGGLPQGLPRPDGPALPPPGMPAAEPDAASVDLWEHVLRVLDLLGEGPSFPLAFAALLHDVGKPRTVGRTPERYTFYGHEHVGRRMASEICLRLKTSNEERERVEWLVEKHQILADVRADADEQSSRRCWPTPASASCWPCTGPMPWPAAEADDHVVYCEQLLREWSADDLNPPPLLTGHDLQRAGLEPGPIYKRLLDAVREGQLEGTVKTPQAARSWWSEC